MGFFTWLLLAFVFWGVIPAMREKAKVQALNSNARARVLKGIVGMMAKLAKADGRVSEEEVSVARSFIRNLVRSETEYRRCVADFNASVKDRTVGVDRYARLFAGVTSDEAHQLVYEVLWSIAAADGKVDPAEDAMLRRLVGPLGLSSAHYAYCRRRFTGSGSAGGGSSPGSRRDEESELERAYARLGCSPSDSDEKVKSAYRRQAMKYHPDRLRAEGIPDSLLKKATESMAEINAAWELIKSKRGC